jgi:hypothetical protein
MTLATSQQMFSVSGSPMTYELYSWQDANGAWTYRILYTTNRQKTIKEVFDYRQALRGTDRLKRKLSELPAGSTVVWFDRLTLSGARLRGSEGLRYPPQEIVEEVRHTAEKYGIRVTGPEHVYP